METDQDHDAGTAADCGLNMKTIICGGRNYQLTVEDRALLDRFQLSVPITEVVSGGATGADAGGEAWARRQRLPLTVFRADWDRFGKAAGPTRNQAMAEYAEACICFPGAGGTADMRRRAKDRTLFVIDIIQPEPKYTPKQGRL